MAEDNAHALCDQSGEFEVDQVAIVLTRVCAHNYSGPRFTALRKGLILGPSPFPGTAVE